MMIDNKIYEVACLYKNNPNEELMVEIKKLISDYLYAKIKLYAFKDTNIEEVFKKSFLVVLDVINKYDFTSYDSLISIIKIKLRIVIPVIIVDAVKD